MPAAKPVALSAGSPAAEPESAVLSGLLYGHGPSQLIAQLIGVVSVFVYSMVAGIALFTVIKAAVGLRVSAEEEEEGLDITEHGISAYPDPGFHTEAA